MLSPSHVGSRLGAPCYLGAARSSTHDWLSLETHLRILHAPPQIQLGHHIRCRPPRTEIVVTSYHSRGPVGSNPLSQARPGEGWLQKRFDQMGKTADDLAERL